MKRKGKLKDIEKKKMGKKKNKREKQMEGEGIELYQVMAKVRERVEVVSVDEKVKV